MCDTANLEFLARILFSRITLKDIFPMLQIREYIRHDSPTSENDRLISPFCEGFIFTRLRIREVSRN